MELLLRTWWKELTRNSKNAYSGLKTSKSAVLGGVFLVIMHLQALKRTPMRPF